MFRSDVSEDQALRLDQITQRLSGELTGLVDLVCLCEHPFIKNKTLGVYETMEYVCLASDKKLLSDGKKLKELSPLIQPLHDFFKALFSEFGFDFESNREYVWVKKWPQINAAGRHTKLSAFPSQVKAWHREREKKNMASNSKR